MKAITILILVLAAAVLVSGCTSYGEPAGSMEDDAEHMETDADAGDHAGEELEGTVIEITSSGFEPTTVTVAVGDTVTFVNRDTRKHWPASDVHPTHKSYPGSDISKCGSEELIFDACAGLEHDGSYAFTFNEAGTWGFHDHLSAGLRGSVIVQ